VAEKNSSRACQNTVEIAETIEANLYWLTEAESEDQGKPVVLAKRMDIPRAALNFTAFAEAVTSFEHVFSLFT
jgi:aminomuconate-semialdehyde/2-hydroxymuconate-6-semialdehyde dehydrogenase